MVFRHLTNNNNNNYNNIDYDDDDDDDSNTIRARPCHLVSGLIINYQKTEMNVRPGNIG